MIISPELTTNVYMHEPDLYISSLEFYSAISPEPTLISSVENLQPGLNIICSPGAKLSDVKLSKKGHSAGKTILTRTIRYVMGEQSIGTVEYEGQIQATFPHGYVAAHLHVLGQDVAVLRPFSKRRRSYFCIGGTIKELLANKEQSVSPEEYLEKTGLIELVDRVRFNSRQSANQQVQYNHMLACVSPDQETNLSSLTRWRTKDSNADFPSTRKPNLDTTSILRALLGMLDSDDHDLTQKLYTLEKGKERAEQALDQLASEPKLREEIYKKELIGHLQKQFRDKVNLEQLPLQNNSMFDDSLLGLGAKAIKELQEKLSEFDRKQVLGDNNSQLGLSQKAVDKNVDPEKKKLQMKRLQKLAGKKCLVGDIGPEDCAYVKARNIQLGIVIPEGTATAIKTDSSDAKECRQQEIADAIDECRNDIYGLKQALGNVKKWSGNRRGGGSKSLQKTANDTLRETKKDIKTTESLLQKSLENYKQKKQALEIVFSAAVKCTFADPSYGGEIILANDKISAFITYNGKPDKGASMRRLAVLLCSFCLQIYNAQQAQSYLPGFLMHDSPRPADLSSAHFAKFLQFTARLQEQFPRNGIPFQYIVTTTTLPPQDLQDGQFVKSWINSDKTENLLFKCELHEMPSPPEQQNLFS